MKFEYKIVTVSEGNDEEERRLNELGEEGWEIVVASGEVGVVILKRVKQ